MLGITNTAVFVVCIAAAVVVFLGWAMRRQEKNYKEHLVKSKALYDDQANATKRMYDESNLLRSQMLEELKEIRKLLGNRKS
jgi:Flp pilus assembly protein TadB